MFMLAFFAIVKEILYFAEGAGTMYHNDHDSALENKRTKAQYATRTHQDMLERYTMPRPLHDYIFSTYAPYFHLILREGEKDILYYDRFVPYP